MKLLHLIALATASGALATSAAAGDCPFQDQGGIVVVEFESKNPVPDWAEYTQFAGFTGDSYFRWDGPNHWNQPGNGVIQYDFEVDTAGVWQLSIHNRHNHPLADQENDVWVRMDNGAWIKVYSNLGSATINVWNWHTRFDFGSAPHTDALYNLSAGQHTIYFSGRSNGWMMDRFHLYRTNHPNPTNTNMPESPCGDSPLFYCQSKTSSNGCVANMSTSNVNAQPVSGANNYEAILLDAEGQTPGLFFSTTFGTNNLPFQGGTLCIQTPFKRSPIQFSTGNPGACNGRYSLLINDGSLISVGDGFDPGPGGTSFIQAWHRDAGLNDGFNTVLSNAVRLDWQ